jgi:outer membrane protein
MKIRKFLAAIALIFFAGFSLNAQSNSYNIPEQLGELIKKAFDNYPKLKEGDALIRMSQSQRDLAKAGYLPTIDGEASYRYAKPTPELSFPGVGTFAFFPANNYDFHLGATLPIWDFGRTQANVQKTLAQIQASKDNLENNKQTIAYQVAELYVAIIFYNKSIEVQNEQIKLLQENEKIISDRVKDGDALKFDLLSTQVKRNNAQNQLIDLQNSLKKNYEFLDMLTGAQGDGYITRADITFNTEGHEEVTSDKNYDLIILNDQLKATQIDFKSARNNWLPNLFAQGKIGYANGYIPDVNKIMAFGSVGVGLSIPIYGGDRPNFRMKIAKINAEAAKYNIEATKLNLDKDIAQAKSDLDATTTKLKNYEIQVAQAQEALDLANIRYKAGVITNLELLTAQTDLQNAKLGQIQLAFMRLQSTLTLNKIGGTKFW